MSARAKLTALIAALAFSVPLLASCAKHDYSQPVSPSSVHFSSVAWGAGGPCKHDGGIVNVTATNSSGPYTLYDVQCGDGLTVPAAH